MDILASLLGGPAVSVASDGCTGFCKCNGDSGTQAASGAGDQCCFAIKAKAIEYAHPGFVSGLLEGLWTGQGRTRFPDV